MGCCFNPFLVVKYKDFYKKNSMYKDGADDSCRNATGR